MITNSLYSVPVMMNMKSSLLFAFAAGALAACSAGPDASPADVASAIEDNRFRDAHAGLLVLRQQEGANEQNTQQLAQVLIELGDGYTAERYLSEISDQSSAQWVSMRAHSLILQGRAERAQEILAGFEGEAPADGTHHWLRVWAAMEIGENDEAVALVDEALAQFPQSAPLHAKAARLAVWEDNWEAANRHIGDALANEPDNYEALLLKGEGRIAKGDLEGALPTYQTAMEAYPDYAIPAANVAGLLLDLERLDEAEVVIARAINAHPDFALLKFNLARLQVVREDWGAARETVQALPTEWRKTFPAATLLEGEIEAALGNHAMARTLYESLLDDPRFVGQVAKKIDELP